MEKRKIILSEENKKPIIPNEMTVKKISEEVVESTAAMIKSEHPALFEELKEIELRDGDLRNDTGTTLTEIIVSHKPGLNTVDVISLRHEIRRLARIENGQNTD